MKCEKSSILYLVPDIIGPPSGIGRYCRLIAQALYEAGENLSIIALADTNGAKHMAAMLFPNARYVPCNYSRKRFTYEAIRAGQQQRPKLVLVGHVNFSPIGYTIAKLLNTQYVTFIYGIDVVKPLSAWRRWTLQHSANVLSISNFTALQARQNNAIAENNIRILYNCLDPQLVKMIPPKRNQETLSLLTVARISLAEQYKGHDYVIRALPELRQRFPNLVYDIVGDGDGRQVLEGLAAQLGVTDAVHFYGFVSESELQRCYADASIFIMPSRNEGFGFVFAEAMAYGVPAIGGNVDATPEVIVDGETGFLVNPTSVEEIVAAVSKLLSNQDLRQRMGQAAKLHVQQHFSYAQFQKTLCGYLAELGTKSLV